MKSIITLAAALASALSAMSAVPGEQPLRMWYSSPAAYFEESLPIGNGRLGALVYGGTDDNTIYINDITFWTGKPVDHDEDKGASVWIPRIRKALFDEDYRAADSLQLRVQGHNSCYYQPLATLHIDDLNGGTTSGYRRELDIDSAICRDRYTRGGVTFEREYFASSPDRVIAMRIRSDRKGGINCRVRLTSQVTHGVKASGGGQLTMTGHATGDGQNSIHFCSILSVRTDGGGRVAASDSVVSIGGATEAVLYFVNRTSYNGPRRHPVTQGAPYIDSAADDAWHLTNYSYDEIRSRHVADYRGIFGRFGLRIGQTRPDNSRTTEQQLRDYTDRHEPNTYLETLYAQYGRYLLISSSRTPGVPANLQGLWAPALWSPWRGNYTVNINLEENYWPAEVANMEEMVAPLDSFITYLSQNGRYTAKNYYGIDKGWCSSHNSDLWAMTNPVGEKREKPEWANWNMGGAWLVSALWEKFRFGQDRDYLRRTAYPLMKGAAEFCLEWLMENPKHPGELITAPSTSPENEYVTDRGYHGMTCYGGTADLAIIRELFINTSAAAAELRTDKSLRKRLDDALKRLHPYKVGRRGNLQEWYYDWDDYDWKHRHQSHLIGLYPGHHLTDPVLQRAAAKTLEIKGSETTGWSTGWRINLWARLRNSAKAYEIYRKLLTYVSPDNYDGPDRRRSGGTYPNLFDAHPPFQIDGNFGGTAGVCEMLVQSVEGRIDLLPALPKEWSEGQVRGIRVRGGCELDMEWKDGRPVKVDIRAKRSGSLTVAFGGIEKKVKARKNRVTTVRF